MKKKRWHKTAMLLFTCVLLGGTTASGWQQAAQAQPIGGSAWDALNDWLPPNVQGGNAYDPVQSLLATTAQTTGSTTNVPTGQTPNSPLLHITTPQPKNLQDPVDITSGSLNLDEKDFSYTTFGPPLQIDRFYHSGNASHKSLFGYGWTIPEDRYLEMFQHFTITDFLADGTVERMS